MLWLSLGTVRAAPSFVDGQFVGLDGSGLCRWVTRATVSYSTCNRPDLQGCLVVAHPPWDLIPFSGVSLIIAQVVLALVGVLGVLASTRSSKVA